MRVRVGERLAPGAGATPEPLLAGPEVVGPLTGQVPVADLVWKPVDGAKAYRVEVAEDIAFYQPVRADSVPNTTLSIKDLSVGHTYYWHVRAVSADGAAGRSSRIYAFRLSDAPPPAAASKPKASKEAD